MDLSSKTDIMNLYSISPLDGRYIEEVKEIIPYFSENALIKTRIDVEVKYFEYLLNFLYEKTKDTRFIYDDSDFEKIRNPIGNQINILRIKKKESEVNHDVKAVEYILREHVKDPYQKEFVHFGLTSQDINNTSYPIMIRNFINECYLPQIKSLQEEIFNIAISNIKVPMLSRTHGQPASPTTLGKEIMVFYKRIEREISKFPIEFSCKFGGATGALNAHYVSFPDIDWVNFANGFVKNELGLVRTEWTTQIDPYDDLCGVFDSCRRINNILIDFSRDMWSYISMDYFIQKNISGEVGSSAMPHKINPIYFENAEGNLGIANSLFGYLSDKLPISRLQRDLTDSTTLRNVGVPFGHTILSFKSLIKGISRLCVNHDKLNFDLNEHFEVITEGIVSILKVNGIPEPYEKFKEFSRGQKLDRQMISEFVRSLNLEESLVERISKVTPLNYIGFLLNIDSNKIK